MPPKVQPENIFGKNIKKSPIDILTAGKPIEKVENEIAVTQEDNVIPIKKEEISIVQTENTNKSEEIIIKNNQSNKTKDIEKMKQSQTSLFVIDIDESIDEKQYANFYLRKSTLNLIDKYAGKKKDGKSGMNKSQLVDFILQQAFTVLDVKTKKKE